jgi:hypothetical protein
MKYIKATIATSATTDRIVVNVEFSVVTPAGLVVAIAPPQYQSSRIKVLVSRFIVCIKVRGTELV